MSSNIRDKDIRARGYVLRRTNYGEADRILNIITPIGKISAIAKGVRKEKSKLAGGIEMFSLTDFNIHQGRSEFGVVTGAKMIKYHSEIVKDFAKMELAAMILKKISIAAESSDNIEYFQIVDQCFAGLDMGEEAALIEAWFLIRLANAMGEEVNLYRDTEGKILSADKKYEWDKTEAAFFERDLGGYGENEIKMLRLMLSNNLSVVRRVKINNEIREKILTIARMVGRV